MQEQGIIRLSTINKPVHRLDDILSGRNGARILLVVCENDHVLGFVPEALSDKGSDVVHLSHQHVHLPLSL